MSTEYQKYSTQNQSRVIAEYARERGLTIVRRYADEGKSGLSFEGRPALQRLITDVQSGSADFGAVLVYDVSRWGRFQNSDEGAYYEFICKKAGIRVQYCAEPYVNDGGLIALLMKSLKRAMAAEYSRELSVKVWNGQCKLTELGFRTGGQAGYGLRRLLLDEQGRRKCLLASGEQKALRTDRVILVPGPPREVATVRRIFDLFIHERETTGIIAAILNRERIPGLNGAQWKRQAVYDILRNEKYAGTNVFNCTSRNLTSKLRRNPRSMWVRRVGAFEPLVSLSDFNRAQGFFEKKRWLLSDEELLEGLRRLWREKGVLSVATIAAAKDLPSTRTYALRFGTLARAYRLIGYDFKRTLDYVEINRRFSTLITDLVADVSALFRSLGISVRAGRHPSALIANNDVAICVGFARWIRRGPVIWHVRLPPHVTADFAIVARMKEGNDAIQDFYLLPRREMPAPKFYLTKKRRAAFEAYRCKTLDFLSDSLKVHLTGLASQALHKE
jgi:DNA invertase Pin-like site-specific DNA recombinase